MGLVLKTINVETKLWSNLSLTRAIQLSFSVVAPLTLGKYFISSNILIIIFAVLYCLGITFWATTPDPISPNRKFYQGLCLYLHDLVLPTEFTSILGSSFLTYQKINERETIKNVEIIDS